MPSFDDDQFWRLLEPLLLAPPLRYRHPGRRRLDGRMAIREPESGLRRTIRDLS
jgi:transposase